MLMLAMSSPPYAELIRLRGVIAAVEREMGPVTRHSESQAVGSTSGLVTAWDDLLKVLAVGPEPDLDECPYCARVIVRGATRCRECWRKLSPVTVEPNPAT
jgi:hypothetical protein